MKKIEKIIKYINEDEYCIVNKELLISYFQDYKKHDCIQKSMVGFIAPVNMPCINLSKIIAKVFEKSFLYFEMNTLIEETTAINLANGIHLTDGLVIVTQKIIDEILKLQTSKVVVFLDNVKVFQQISSVNILKLLRSLLYQRTIKNAQNNNEQHIKIEDIFFVVCARNDEDISEGLQKCVSFSRVRMMTNEEKVLNLKNYFSEVLEENPDYISALQQFSESADTKEKWNRILDCNKCIIRNEYNNGNPKREINTIYDNALDDLINKSSKNTTWGGIFAIGIVNGMGHIQRYRVVFTDEGSGDIVFCCGGSENLFRIIKTSLLLINKTFSNINISDKNLYFDVCPDRYNIEGRSSSLAVGLSIFSALMKTTAQNRVGAIGILDCYGDILPVGYLLDKLIAAYNSKLQYVLIPYEQRGCIALLPEYIKNKMQSIPVSNFKEAISIFQDLEREER